MKSFFKTVLAALLALVIWGVLSGILYTCSMIAVLSTLGQESVRTTSSNDVLFLKINSEVAEIPSSMPFSFDVLNGLALNDDMSLREYLNAIGIAKADPNIVGIYLNTDGMAAAPATYEALHDALLDFRSSGKWILAYNDNYSLGQYYVASAANDVYVNTIGTVTFDGMSSVLTYPKALLDKLGVEMQVFRVGQYKSAVEPYLIEHISEENRYQTETYLRGIWNRMVADISETRGISVERLNALADSAVSYMQPDELMETGLLTGQVYKSDVEQMILQLTGKSKLSGVYAKDLVTGALETLYPQKKRDKVAVIYAVGEIASEARNVDGTDAIYYEDMIDQIREVAEDSDVKAVVLRVNSPGGSGFASEQIWKALDDLKAHKPLVVSMGDYAASGGYYISCLADYVIAEPNTLTGSIGVFGVIPNFSNLASGTLGVNFEEVKTHEMGTLTTMRAATPQERQKVQHGVEWFYEQFTMRCAEGRNLPQDSIKVIGGGRVWTGTDALAIGLVDELGDLNLALDKAAELAGLQPGAYSCTLGTTEDGFASFLEAMSGDMGDVTLEMATRLAGTTPGNSSALRFLKQLENADPIQARSFDAIVY